MVETRVETRTVCPAELDQARPAKPAPAAGAQVTANDAGGAWIKALAGWGDALAALFDGAKAGCPAPPAGSAAP